MITAAKWGTASDSAAEDGAQRRPEADATGAAGALDLIEVKSATQRELLCLENRGQVAPSRWRAHPRIRALTICGSGWPQRTLPGRLRTFTDDAFAGRHGARGGFCRRYPARAA